MNDALTLFTEAFTTRLAPLFHEVTLGAIRQFHPEQYPSAAPIAAAGALLASLVLYGIGISLRRLPRHVSTEAQQARVAKMQSAAREWLPRLLIFAPTPLGVALIPAAGFFGIRPVIAALAILAAELLWRVSPLL